MTNTWIVQLYLELNMELFYLATWILIQNTLNQCICIPKEFSFWKSITKMKHRDLLCFILYSKSLSLRQLFKVHKFPPHDMMNQEVFQLYLEFSTFLKLTNQLCHYPIVIFNQALLAFKSPHSMISPVLVLTHDKSFFVKVSRLVYSVWDKLV